MKKFILLLVDIVLLYASLWLTLLFRYNNVDTELWQKHFWPFSIVFILWIVVFFINGLYEIRKVKNDYKFYGRLVSNLLINTAIAFTFFYIIFDRFSYIRPQKVLIILVLVFAVLWIFWRKLFPFAAEIRLLK